MAPTYIHITLLVVAIVTLQVPFAFPKSVTPRLQCGASTYDPANEMCCMGQINPSEGFRHAQCCGTTSIDAASTMCCTINDVRGSGATFTFASIRGMVYPECCHGAVIDLTKEMCCSPNHRSLVGVVSPACCNGLMYSRASEMCCDKSLGSTHGLALPKCCGKRVYDSSEEECVRGQVQVKMMPNGEKKV